MLGNALMQQPLEDIEDLKYNNPLLNALFWGGVAGLGFFSITATSLLLIAARSFATPGGFQDHIILMPLAFVLLAPCAAVVWRLGDACGLSRGVTKFVHGSMMSTAAIMASFGVAYIWDAHNQAAVAAASTGIAVHFQSAHSWIGFAAFLLFGMNAASAFLIFGLPYASSEMRASFKPLHVFAGGTSIVMTIAGALMGIVSFAQRGNNASAKDLEYKFASLSLVGILASLALVFYSTSLQRNDSKRY